MHLEFKVAKNDFTAAGRASSTIKHELKKVGIDPLTIKRIVTASFEAEVNIIAHSEGGTMSCDIENDRVVIHADDRGPGIPNLELAMQEGWSTASDEVRALGYGAGMGLPNIKKNSDRLDIQTAAGSPTRITMSFLLG